MRFCMQRSSWALAVLAVAACADAGQPLAPEAGISARRDRRSAPVMVSGNPQAYVLRQEPSAPPLERYSASFWAVKGQDRTLEIHYAQVTPGASDRPFLKFTVFGESLDRGRDGKRLSDGDSVRIDVQIDPVDFRVDFEPSGLEFHRSKPARLRLAYDHVDRDLDRDGDQDEVDDLILQSTSTFYHYESSGGAWDKKPTVRNGKEKWFEALLPGFSGYAVSW